MLIPDEVRKCVAFLLYKDNTGFKFAGTCFFVATPLSSDPKKINFMYVVTAAHVINHIRERGADGKVYIRVNFRDSTVKLMPSSVGDWLTHPNDPTVDVAVLASGITTDVDYRVYPLDRFATEDIITREAIGLGEEVFIVGLFHEH